MYAIASFSTLCASASPPPASGAAAGFAAGPAGGTLAGLDPGNGAGVAGGFGNGIGVEPPIDTGVAAPRCVAGAMAASWHAYRM